MDDPYQARLDALLADGNLQGALRKMDAELERSPRDREALHIRASLHALAMDWKGVAVDLSAIVAGDSKARLNGALANAYRQTGKDEAALREADREVRVAPEDAGVRGVRARLRQAAGDLAGAREDLLEAARLKGDEQGSWLALADVEAEMELNQDCLRHVEEAAKLGNDWRCLLRRGAVKNELRRYAEAETDLDAVIFEIAELPALAGQLEAAMRHRAWSKFCQGKRDALEDVQFALNLDPHDPQALCIRGAILVMRDDPAGRADLDKAISIDPEFALAYAFRASAFLKKCELAAARRDFAKAGELRPGLREVFAEEISRAGESGSSS